MFSKNLQNAIDAINTIDDTEEMHVLADYYNRRVNFLRKQKGKNIVIGDTIVWKFGGLEVEKLHLVQPNSNFVEYHLMWMRSVLL